MRATPCRNRAFTLTELIIAMGLTSVVIGVTTASIVIASRAMPKELASQRPAAAAASAFDRLSSDLSAATGVVSMGASSISLLVADRTGDTKEDLVSYAWDGTSGQPLLFVLNDGKVEAITPGLDGFGLLYTTADDGDRIAAVTAKMAIVNDASGDYMMTARCYGLPTLKPAPDGVTVPLGMTPVLSQGQAAEEGAGMVGGLLTALGLKK